jgi:uncharacterized protein YndB with AHSA1/START domain
MSRLHVEADGTADASVENVWALVADANTYAAWGPWDEGGYESAGTDGAQGVGAVRWFRAGRTRTVEKILEMEEPRRLVYTVMKGVPVRNYRAEVTLTATASGTQVTWTATWDKTLGGRLVHRALAKFYPEMMVGLVSAAERRQAQGAR